MHFRLILVCVEEYPYIYLSLDTTLVWVILLISFTKNSLLYWIKILLYLAISIHHMSCKRMRLELGLIQQKKS